ncbi:MAG: type III-B CRISPR module RAMP protein Cmr6 [Desulfurococcales archaeon]|nr:type III-B CRISPR module RAMP protein Cmr6 [Desulfurococcales archaeon]
MGDLFKIVCLDLLQKMYNQDNSESVLRNISPYSMLNLLIYCKSPYIINTLISSEDMKRDAAELFSKASSHVLKRIVEKGKKDIEKYDKDLIEGIASFSIYGFSAFSDIFAKSGLKLIVRKYKAVHRVIYGASSGIGKNVFEIGLEIDPLYGIPVIRGSGIKGAVRFCAENELKYHKNMKTNASGKKNANMKNPEELGRIISTLFGCSKEDRQRYVSCRDSSEESVGAAIFLDAYPIGNPRDQYIVIPDVITPHYMRRGKEILDEAGVKPVPVVHISISFGTVFVFPIVIDLLRLKAEKVVSEEKADILLGMWLKCALEEIGVGLRTSVGYGVFKMHEERGEDRNGSP